MERVRLDFYKEKVTVTPEWIVSGLGAQSKSIERVVACWDHACPHSWDYVAFAFSFDAMAVPNEVPSFNKPEAQEIMDALGPLMTRKLATAKKCDCPTPEPKASPPDSGASGKRPEAVQGEGVSP